MLDGVDVFLAGCGERLEDSASRPNVLIVIVDDLASFQSNPRGAIFHVHTHMVLRP